MPMVRPARSNHGTRNQVEHQPGNADQRRQAHPGKHVRSPAQPPKSDLSRPDPAAPQQVQAQQSPGHQLAYRNQVEPQIDQVVVRLIGIEANPVPGQPESTASAN